MKPLALRLVGATGGAAALALVVALLAFVILGSRVELVLGAVVGGLASLIVLARPEFGLHLLLINTVGAFSSYFRPPTIGPVSLVIALHGLLLLGFCVQLSLYRRRLVLDVAEGWLLFGYVVLVALSILLAERSGAYNLVQFRQLVALGVFAYFMIVNTIDTPMRLDRLLATLALINAILVVSGLLYQAGLLESRGVSVERLQGRTVGFIGNPNSLAFALNMLLPFTLFLMVQARRLWHRAGLALLALGSIYMILSTLSRGGFVALVASLLVIILYTSRDRRLFAVSAVLALVVYLLLPQALFDRFEEGHSLQGYDRYKLTMVGLRMALDNPVSGVGFGNFESYFPRYDVEHRGGMTAPHNMYTSIAAQTGLPSLVLYLVLLVAVWRRAMRLTRRFRRTGQREREFLTIAIQATLANIVVFGMSSHIEHEYLVFVVIGLTIALDRATRTAPAAGFVPAAQPVGAT